MVLILLLKQITTLSHLKGPEITFKTLESKTVRRKQTAFYFRIPYLFFHSTVPDLKVTSLISLPKGLPVDT